MLRFLSLLALFSLLSACADFAPGDDPKGLQYQTTGLQVLQAARTYMDENARPPRTLQDLVPKYLPALPIEPTITYDAKLGRFAFLYTQEGPRGSQVECHSVIGETDWVCTGIFQQRQ